MEGWEHQEHQHQDNLEEEGNPRRQDPELLTVKVAQNLNSFEAKTSEALKDSQQTMQTCHQELCPPAGTLGAGASPSPPPSSDFFSMASSYHVPFSKHRATCRVHMASSVFTSKSIQRNCQVTPPRFRPIFLGQGPWKSRCGPCSNGYQRTMKMWIFSNLLKLSIGKPYIL